MDKNIQLDRLFSRWPGHSRKDFHCDGIVNEARFHNEQKHVLFIMAEPSSKGRRYANLLGCDLRTLYDNAAPRKELTHNVALWMQVLVDGRNEYSRLPQDDVQETIRRVAIINLKKISGKGQGDYEKIRQHAKRDHGLLNEQVRIIDADLIVACGPKVYPILADIFSASSVWNQVIKANHPSLRSPNAPAALQRIVDRWVALTNRST